MRWKKRSFISIVVLILCFVLWYIFTEITKEPPRYKLEFIKVPIDDSFQVYPDAINDNGHVLLRVQSPRAGGPGIGKRESFLWKSGELVSICPECDGILSVDLNNREEVIGRFAGAENEPERPFYWNPRDGLTDLLTESLRSELGDFDTAITVKLNNRGEILLQSSNSGDPYTGYGPGESPSPCFIVSASDDFKSVEVLQPNIRFWDMNDSGILLGSFSEGGFEPLLLTENGEIREFAKERRKSTLFGARLLNKQGELLGFRHDQSQDEAGLKLSIWSPREGFKFVGNLPITPMVGFNDSGAVFANRNVLSWRRQMMNQLRNKGYQFEWLLRSLKDWLNAGSAIEVWVLKENEFVNLNSLIQEELSWCVPGVLDMNNKGQMVGRVLNGGRAVPVILTPIDTNHE